MSLNAIVYPHFDPVIHFWIISIRWYAIAYIAGILLGWWYVLGLARRNELWAPRVLGLNRDQIDDLVLYVTLGVIVGGRLGSVLFYNTAMIWQEPLEIVRIDHGGMSFHGGLIGVALALLLFARMKHTALLKVSDLIAPCVPIGLFFGRLANFVNNELWGRQTTVTWGFTDTSRGEDVVVHPSQLYEAALEGIVLFIISRLATHRFGQLKKPGAVTGLFLAGYGLFRMAIEFVREPDAGWLHDWPLGLTMGMVLSFLMFAPGVWLLLRSRNAAPEPVAEKAVEAPEPEPEPVLATETAPPSAPKPRAKAAAAPRKTAAKPAAKSPAKPRTPKPKS